jgi:hypothetical protein
MDYFGRLRVSRAGCGQQLFGTLYNIVSEDG